MSELHYQEFIDFLNTVPATKQLIVPHDVNLSHAPDFDLPANMKIIGSLTIAYSQISKLPENLQVTKNLDASNSALTTVPQSLKVGNELSLCQLQLKSLPNFYYVPILVLDDSTLKIFPESLHAKRLRAQDASLPAISESLRVEELCLSGATVVKLPPNAQFHVLDISNTNIMILPENLVVFEKLNISNTPIKILPKTLEVHKAFIMNESEVTTLPEGFLATDISAINSMLANVPKVLRGHLCANRSKIISFPDGFEINGSLGIEQCAIEELPANIKFRGACYAWKSALRSLPDNFPETLILDISETHIEVLPSSLKTSQLRVKSPVLQIIEKNASKPKMHHQRVIGISDLRVETLLKTAEIQSSEDTRNFCLLQAIQRMTETHAPILQELLFTNYTNSEIASIGLQKWNDLQHEPQPRSSRI